MILTSRRKILVTGKNQCGQLGLNHTIHQLVAVENPYLSSVEAIAATELYSLAISERKLYFFGKNMTLDNILTPKVIFTNPIDKFSAHFNHILILSSKKLYVYGYNDGYVLGLNDTEKRFISFTENTFIKEGIEGLGTGSGYKSSFVITKNSGDVYTFGYNSVRIDLD